MEGTACTTLRGRVASKAWQRRVAFGADSAPAHQQPNRRHDDTQVEPEAHSIDVLDVETKPSRPIDSVSTGDLSEAGQSRPDIVAPSLLRRIQCQVLHQ